MDLTHDKMCSVVKKRQTVTEAHIDVKATYQRLLASSVLCWFYLKTQEFDSEDLSHSASTGPPNLEDGGNHDPRGTEKCP